MNFAGKLEFIRMAVSVKFAIIKPSVPLLAMIKIRKVDFMGFLSKIFGAKQDHKFSGSVHATMFQVTKTAEQVEMLRNGYKETIDNEIFPPDTVWIGPRSKVYHYLDCCSGYALADGTVAVPEGEALRLGLHRCKKCDWHGIPVPEPCVKPAPKAKPVSRAIVEPVKRKW